MLSSYAEHGFPVRVLRIMSKWSRFRLYSV